MGFMNEDRLHILLTPPEMADADRAAAHSGIDSYRLMEAAGQAVAASALKHYPQAQRFVVLCGPGNNGGDGYVAARALSQSGAATEVFALGDPLRLKGDAASARDRWHLPIDSLAVWSPRAGDVVIDALFGAGLARAVPAEVIAAIAQTAAMGLPVIAVDLPSGLDGRTGQVLGAAFEARHTVTFMARKPGHLLLPGRTLCGSVEVFDIGIPWRIVKACAGTVAENAPVFWRTQLRQSDAGQHKFSRGHLGVFSGGPSATGAARMSAMAGLKAGAGLVTIAAPRDAMDANAAHLTAVMLQEVTDLPALEDWISDKRLSAFVLGPGFGIGDRARDFALALKARSLVLDADGISSFRDAPEALFDAFSHGEPRLVLTPHEGEFGRLFPDLAGDDTLGKVDKAIMAARRANAAVVYKGGDSVIASPDGRALINTNAPPWLATAGSGDVLSGIIGAFLAQGMPAFEAAAAGVWLHGEAAKRAGEGMTAEDLVSAVLPFQRSVEDG